MAYELAVLKHRLWRGEVSVMSGSTSCGEDLPMGVCSSRKLYATLFYVVSKRSETDSLVDRAYPSANCDLWKR